MLNYKMWSAPKCWTIEMRQIELHNFGCIQNVKLPRVTLNFKCLKPGCTPWKLNLLSQGAPCIKLWNFLISFTLFCFCFILCMVTEFHMRPQQKCTLISKVAIPLIFMTLITLLWLSIALFWQHVVTRSVQQKIKALVKVNPFSVVLLSDWLGLLFTDQSISGRTSSRLYEY